MTLSPGMHISVTFRQMMRRSRRWYGSRTEDDSWRRTGCDRLRPGQSNRPETRRPCEGMDRTGLSQNLATLGSGYGQHHAAERRCYHDSAKSETYGTFQTGDGGAQTMGLMPTILHCIANLGHTTLNTTGSNSTTARDGHDILDGHQEGLVPPHDRGWGYRYRQRPSAP